jgi:hypothetical protein
VKPGTILGPTWLLSGSEAVSAQGGVASIIQSEPWKVTSVCFENTQKSISWILLKRAIEKRIGRYCDSKHRLLNLDSLHPRKNELDLKHCLVVSLASNPLA